QHPIRPPVGRRVQVHQVGPHRRDHVRQRQRGVQRSHIPLLLGRPASRRAFRSISVITTSLTSSGVSIQTKRAAVTSRSLTPPRSASASGAAPPPYSTTRWSSSPPPSASRPTGSR